MVSRHRISGVYIFFGILLAALAIFGCSGSGDDPLVTGPGNYGTITGSITASSTIAAIRTTEGSILASTNFSSAIVFLESDPSKSSHPDSSGNFSISQVPFGQHNVIASLTSSAGTVYKTRFSGITVSSNQTAQAHSKAVSRADRRIKIRLKDTQSNLISNAILKVWGDEFTYENGEYISPPMPEDAVATVTVVATGRTTVEVPAQFTSAELQTFETVLPPTGSTNLSPTVTLAASSLLVSNGSTITFTATAKDPENGAMTYQWEASSGSLSTTTSGLQATWTAPSSGTGSSTVTFKATDAGGLFARTTLTVSYMPVANQKPVVDIVADSSTLTGGIAYALVATATYPDGSIPAVTYLWSVPSGSLSNTTQSITDWTTPTVTATTSVIVSLTVTDTAGESTTKTRSFNVIPAPATPTAQISKPAANAILPAGSVLFSGNVKLPNGGTLPADYYQWHLKHQSGSLYAIASMNSFSLSLMATGSYLATLTATSSEGLVSSTSVAFKINAPPESLAITVKPSQTTFAASASIIFEGSASDPDDGQTLSYAWEDYSHIRNATSTLPSGKTISFADFVPGSHTITLRVSDSLMVDGVPHPASATTSVIVGIATNTEPTPTITSPAAATKWYFVNTPVPFAGNAADLETAGGYVASTSQSWSITGPNNYANDLTATTSFTLAFTEPGTYTIELTASDTLDAESSVQRTLYINATPAVSIAFDPDNARFSRGEQFTLTANVDESGTNDDLTIQWWDQPANIMFKSDTVTGSTYSYQYATTTSGIHQIEARIIDSCGVATSTIRSILINDLPIPGITINFPQYATAPDNIPILLATSSPITISYWATDSEKLGLLTSSQVTCHLTSAKVNGTSIDTIFSASNPIAPLTLDPGRYTMAVEATDDHSCIASQSFEFIVWKSTTYLESAAGDAKLASPTSMVFSGNKFYIADWGNSKLKIFSDFTSTPQIIGGPGATPGSFTSLVGVSVSGTKVFTLEMVPDTSARIQVWNNLATESNYGSYGLSGGEGTAIYNNPGALAYYGSSLYLSETEGNRIKKLDPNTGLATKLDTYYGTSNQFNLPTGIRLLNTSLLFVADTENDRVVKLDANLNPNGIWEASAPVDITEFSNYYITVDKSGNKLQIWDTLGKLQSTVGSSGSGFGQFKGPSAAVMNGNNLVVLEHDSSRIQIFTLPTNSPW